MKAPKLLNLFFKKPWFNGFILLIFILIAGYYLLLDENTPLFINNYKIPYNNKNVIALIVFVIGILISLLGGLLLQSIQNKHYSSTEPQIPNINIENKIFPNADNQTSPEVIEDSNKFYPTPFFPDLKYFEGRTKLKNDIGKQLEKTHKVAIHDISGIGKTFVSYKFAQEQQDRYDKIFFVNAEREKMLSSLAEMAVLLNPQLKEEPDQTILANSFRNWLETNERWLVIYDNVDESETLKPFVPTNLNGDCLFTSNFEDVKELGTIIDIKKLSQTESKRLLFSRATSQPHKNPSVKDQKEAEAFAKLVEEIDGHPLALNTTGAFISKNRYSFQMFVERLENEPEILLENEDGFDNYQRKSVLKAFSIAIDDISQQKPQDKFKDSSTIARNILNMVGFIAPENIPEDFLLESFAIFNQPKSIFHSLRIKFIDKIYLSQEYYKLWEEIRLKLFEYDLLKFDKSQTKLTTHRLIQKVLIKKLDSQSFFQRVFNIFFLNNKKNKLLQLTADAVDVLFEYSEYETKENCETYTPHAVVLTEHLNKAGLNSKNIASIYDKIGRHFHQTIKYNDAIEYFEKAIDGFEQLFGRENENVATCLNNLGEIYRVQGRYNEAMGKFEKVLKIDEQTIGKQHPQYATHLNNLALVYQAQGRYDEAAKKLEEASQIDEKTIGKEHSDYALRLNNLGIVYHDQGRYDEAIEKFKEALQITEKTISNEHPQYALCLNNLGEVYRVQGRYNEAIEKFEKTLKIVQQTVGKQHPDYARGLSNLGIVCQAQGRYDEAIEKFEEALQIDEKTIGKEHPDYAIHLNNLGIVYRVHDRYNEAIEKFNEALQIFVKVLGEDHPTTQTVMGNLASCRAEFEESKGKK